MDVIERKPLNGEQEGEGVHFPLRINLILIDIEDQTVYICM